MCCGVNARLEVWRQTLESKGFKLSRTKIEYFECKFSVGMLEAKVEVKFDTQAIPKRDIFKYLGSIIQGNGDIDEDVIHRIGVVDEMETHIWRDKIRNEVIRDNVGMAPMQDKMR
ncbi:uncharacterized protein [Nicotiana tomentosiformis]|uniref:uncharacterized protein n=1 Tax=Nicotiana tomentosiformis TaxID=4098 RepID=UPI00388CA583